MGFQVGTGPDAINSDDIISAIIYSKSACSKLGMIPNDASKAAENFDKLADALAKGKPVAVDGTYYIQPTSTVDLAENCIIVGVEGTEKKLILNSTGSYFNLEGQDLVYINGVDFGVSDEFDPYPSFFTADSLAYIKRFKTVNCKFTGTMRLIWHLGSTTVDPTVTTFGYDTFEFCSNKVSDAHLEHSFLALVDCPANLIKIADNEVANFDYQFFHGGITNAGDFVDELTSKKVLFIAENNIVKNDDDWFTPTDGYSYHCFVLFEGKEAIYRHNHVEGLKADGNIAVYDAYFSVDTLNYHDNLWKNNICFYASKTFNTNELMKAKSCTDGLGRRYYRNNTFIVEKSFCDRIGRDEANSKVTLYGLQSNFEEFEAVNNTFNIYALQFPGGSQASRKIRFIDNTFDCYIILGAGSLISYRILNDDTVYTDAHCIVKNNNFIVQSNNGDTGNKQNLVNMVDQTSGTKFVNEVVIEGNHFVGYVNYIANTIFCNKVTIRDNEVEELSNASFPGVVSTGVVKTFSLIENNLFKSAKTFYYTRLPHGNFEAFERSLLYRKPEASPVGLNLYLKSYDPTAATRRITMEHKIYSGDGFRNVLLNMEYGYDVGNDRNYITYKDNADATQTVLLNRQQGGDTYNNKNGTQIKAYDLNALGITGMIYTLVNSSSGTYIRYGSGLPADKFMMCETTITSVLV